MHPLAANRSPFKQTAVTLNGKHCGKYTERRRGEASRKASTPYFSNWCVYFYELMLLLRKKEVDQ
jgi:hypothetical protein